MADVELRAGIKIDLASGAELREQTDELAARLDALNEAPLMQRTLQVLNVSGTGTIGGGLGGSGQVVFTCPQNYAARIVRLALNDAVHTPASPLAAGWIEGYVDSPSDPAGLAFGSPPVGGTTVLPIIYTDGNHAATMLRDQQQLVIVGAALPASVPIGIGLQVWLYPTPGY